VASGPTIVDPDQNGSRRPKAADPIFGEVWLFCTSWKSNISETMTMLIFAFKAGTSMKKFVVVICSMVLAFGLAGCVGKGKAPVGKGKAPVVQTKG
jgi:hypothetical protein